MASPLVFARLPLLPWRHGHSRRPRVDCGRISTKRWNVPTGAVVTASSCLRKTTTSGRPETLRRPTPSGFARAMDTLGITHPLAHDSYLINLASPDPRLWQKSVDAFVVELHRAEILGIPYVVTHPGAFTTASEEAGLRNIVRAIDEASAQTRDLAGPLPVGNHVRPGNRARLAVRAARRDSRRREGARPLGILFRHLSRLCRRVSAGNPKGL